MRAHFLKIKKQIIFFKSELENLPLRQLAEQETLLFILEHQKEIESKDKQFQDLFKKHHINFLLPYGTILKKAYKTIHKLEKQEKLLPKLISSFETKLKASYVIIKPPNEQEKKEKKQARIYFTSLNEKIKVAKSDKDADILTFKEAHGNYYWLHVDNYPGAHTVIFSDSPSAEAFKIARFLAKHFSKAKQKPECDVIETQVKFLKKGKKLGEVYVSKKNVVVVKHDIELERKLFSKPM